MTDWKDHVRVATTQDGTLSTAFVAGELVDGVALQVGDRILIKDQENPEENGIYDVNDSAPPTRSSDADSVADVQFGMTTRIREGTINRGGVWYLTKSVTTLGTDPLIFARWTRVNVRDFGATGDGSTDDTEAFGKAAATGACVYVPAGIYLLDADAIVLAANPEFYGDGAGASRIKIKGNVNGGKIINVTGSNVCIHDLEFFSDSSSWVTLTEQSVYPVFLGVNVENIEVSRLKFSDLFSVSAGPAGGTLKRVTYCIYASNLARLKIQDCCVSGCSGAAFFIKYGSKIDIINNYVKDTGWYSISLDQGDSNFNIISNVIENTRAEGVFMGGGINLMSQIAGEDSRNEYGHVCNNTLSGKYSYGVALRVLSCDNVVIQGNRLIDLDVGTLSATYELSAIRVDTREVENPPEPPQENGPCNNIYLLNNVIGPPAATNMRESRGLYVGNKLLTAEPHTNIHVEGNVVYSEDDSRYWSSGIVFHGFNGGMNGIYVYRNVVVTYQHPNPVVGGAIGFLASSTDGKLENIFLGSNVVTDLRLAGSLSFLIGISFGAYTDKVFNTATNAIEGCYYGTRTFAGSGPTLVNVEDQSVVVQMPKESLFGVQPSRALLTNAGGSTCERPQSGLTANMMYFDTDLQRPVWWNGSTWIDASGTQA